MMLRPTMLLALLGSAAAYSLCVPRCTALRASSNRPRSYTLMQELVPEETEVPADVEVPMDVEEPVDVEVPVDVEIQPVVAADMAAEAAADPLDDNFEMDEGMIAKEALKAEVAEGLAGPRPDKAVVGEILLALEARNPTLSPATSSLLNGKWKMLYASGTSPGLKALQLLLKAGNSAPKSPSGADLVDIEDAFITISVEQPRATSSIRTRVLSFENTVKLSSRLEAESAVRLVETYDSAQSELGNLRLPFQSPVQYKRSVLVSYLDDEILVIRDAFGRPDVLMRVDDIAVE